MRPKIKEISSGGGGTYLNLFDAHPPFQIDGNFGVTAGICEMLVQFDEDDNVILLPALPEEWQNGNFCGPHNTVIDAKWKNGKIISYTIKRRDKKISANGKFEYRTKVRILQLL